MKKVLIILSIFFLFVGCGPKSLKDQEIDCKAEGKNFSAKKVLNHRTGEYEIRGFCKE